MKPDLLSRTNNGVIHNSVYMFIGIHIYGDMGTAVAQLLSFCATNRKVAGSIPAGVSGFFIDIKSFRSH